MGREYELRPGLRASIGVCDSAAYFGPSRVARSDTIPILANSFALSQSHPLSSVSLHRSPARTLFAQFALNPHPLLHTPTRTYRSTRYKPQQQ